MKRKYICFFTLILAANVTNASVRFAFESTDGNTTISGILATTTSESTLEGNGVIRNIVSGAEVLYIDGSLVTEDLSTASVRPGSTGQTTSNTDSFFYNLDTNATEPSNGNAIIFDSNGEPDSITGWQIGHGHQESFRHFSFSFGGINTEDGAKSFSFIASSTTYTPLMPVSVSQTQIQTEDGQNFTFRFGNLSPPIGPTGGSISIEFTNIDLSFTQSLESFTYSVDGVVAGGPIAGLNLDSISSTTGDGSINGEITLQLTPSQLSTILSDSTATIELDFSDNVEFSNEDEASIRVTLAYDGSQALPPVTIYSVTFVEGANGQRTSGGELIQSISEGSSATPPVITPNPGWIFDGWDTTFNNITANLTVTAQYSVDLDNTQPDQDVEVTDERTGGSSSDLTTTFEANSLSLADGADFTLGPNEILDLNGGDLVIDEGAVFTGNGTILGNVNNSGLLRIPIVQIGTVLPQITNVGFVYIERPQRNSNTGSGANGGPEQNPPARVEAPIDNGGTFSTDASLEVTGTFTQTATGTLRLFAEGEEAGVSFSQLIVGDTVTLDGEIQLVLDQAEYGLFTLNPGDTFDVVVINPDVTGKVITLQPGLGYRILATAAIQSQADIAALSPTAYTPTQANDPDVLVELPSGLFTFTLVENDTVLRATYQGSTPLPTPTTGDTEITSLIPSIDTDPASDSWETQNGFDPAVNDMLTRDSDGDGDSDIRELFQGTGKNSGGEQFGFKGSQGNPATQTLSTQFRRSTESTVMDEIEGVNQWSTDLVNWYESGESNGNVVVTFSEQPTDMGTYEIVDVDVTVTNGQTPKLYYRLDLRAKE